MPSDTAAKPDGTDAMPIGNSGRKQGGGQGGGQADWPGAHALDARYRFPWFGGPVYLRVMLGRDRRPRTRSRDHASGSIRRSVLNVMLFALGACLIYTAAAVAILAGSSVLQ
jgi:hypothetical protein